MHRIPLFNEKRARSNPRRRIVKRYALVDASDYETLSQWHWTARRSRKNYYAVRATDALPMHRLLLGLTTDDPITVDHINRKTLDNRRSNLRRATVAENCQNHPGHRSTSRYRGVSWSTARSCWVAGYMLNGRHVHVGRFESQEAAAEAVSRARAERMPFTVEQPLDELQPKPKAARSLPTGVRLRKGGLQGYVQVKGLTFAKTFPATTPVAIVLAWRESVRAAGTQPVPPPCPA